MFFPWFEAAICHVHLQTTESRLHYKHRPAGGSVALRDSSGRCAVRAEGEKKSATMATADSGAVKPLQNAMKMAKDAIQLEGENKHKVVSYTWRLKR